MSTAKFEKLIDLIINEDQARAEQLFHEIVVEKSREIYESLMDEENMEEGSMEELDEDMTSSLLDEIEMEETSDMTMEDEEEFTDDEIEDGDMDVDSEEVDFDDDDGMDDDMEMPDDGMDDEEEHEDIEDQLMNIEDKLDQLMAEFESKLGKDEEEGEEEEEEGEMEEEGMMENVNLKPVRGLYQGKIGGDDGAQTKSTVAFNSGAAGMASKPVKFADGTETMPTGPKGPSNAYSKGEGQVKGAGNFKNTPGKDNFSDKGESTPAPTKKDGATGTKSPVANESRRSTKRRI